MNYTEALAAIKQLEGGADMASAIAAEVDDLKAKNYQVIGEKRSATQKVTAFEEALKSAAQALGIEGDNDALLEQLPIKAKEYKTQSVKLAEEKAAIEAQATEAQATIEQFTREKKWQDYAAKSQANPAVLKRLLADRFDELSIDDEKGVLVGETALKEFVEADEELKPFAIALFGKEEPEQPKGRQPQPLPGNPPGGNAPNKPDPIAAIRARAAGGLKSLQKIAD